MREYAPAASATVSRIKSSISKEMVFKVSDEDGSKETSKLKSWIEGLRRQVAETKFASLAQIYSPEQHTRRRLTITSTQVQAHSVLDPEHFQWWQAKDGRPGRNSGVTALSIALMPVHLQVRLLLYSRLFSSHYDLIPLFCQVTPDFPLLSKPEISVDIDGASSGEARLLSSVSAFEMRDDPARQCIPGWLTMDFGMIVRLERINLFSSLPQSILPRVRYEHLVYFDRKFVGIIEEKVASDTKEMEHVWNGDMQVSVVLNKSDAMLTRCVLC
jgi:hypothetical protein